MRQVIVILILLINFFSLSAYAQSSEDRLDAWREKINSTSFYRMEVRERGIYRITSSDLQTAGYPVNSTSASVVRMYRRGEEIAIRVVATSNDRIDYLEFYGERNDGETDQDLFRNENDFINPYEPVYSRTAVYFLSAGAVISETTPPLRMTPVNVDPTGAENIVNHWYTETYRGEPVGGSAEDTDNFGGLRRSFSRGEATDGNRNKFSSTFRGPRSWTAYNEGQTRGQMSYQLNTTDLASTFSNATLSVRIINFAYRNANLSIRVGVDNTSATEKESQSITRYEAGDELNMNLTSSDFNSSNGSTSLVFVDSNNGTGTNQDQVAAAYINLTYPQVHANIDPTNDRKFTLDPNKKFRLSIGQNNEGRFFDVTDIENPISLSTSVVSGRTEAIVDSSPSSIDIYYSAQFKSPSNLQIANFEFTNNTLNYNYLIVTHSDLMSGATSYSNYRKSNAGGSNSVYLADINKLFNTFSWGEENPLAIRNCIKLLHNENLEFVLLLGKGLDLNYDPYENNYDETPNGTRGYNYIPAFGYPGSDVAYSMGLDDGTGNITEVPAILIGRMSAINNDQLLDYLAKVQEHDALDFDDLWRKDALHLSGGSNARDQESFKAIVNSYKDVFVDTLEGGVVQTISRETDGSIEFIDVSDIVNEGITLMAFYGHASADYADIDIGEASDPTKGYANKGRYPFILMSGCGGGNYLTNSKSWGEDWIETPDKGAVGFMAKSGFGERNALRDFGTSFYAETFQNQIGNHIGRHINKTQENFLRNATFNSALTYSTMEQYELQGDPYIFISPEKVDFALETDHITIIPQSGSLNAADDYFTLNINIKNFGKTFSDNVYIQVERKYSNGQLSANVNVSEAISAPYNNQDVLIQVLNSADDKTLGFGTNEIIVSIGDSVNADGRVISTLDELTLNNNTATVNAQFFSDKVNFIFPQDESVIHDNSIQLYAYDYSLAKEEQNVQFQIAADSAFSSLIAEETIKGEQLFNWSLPLNNSSDTTVYYARVRSLNSDSNRNWDVLSFTKITNSSGYGWMQSSIYQMQNNSISGVTLTGNETDLRWEYPQNDAQISVKAGGATYNNGETYEVSLDGTTYLFEGTCIRSGNGGDKLLFLVFDQFTGEFKGAQARSWDPLQCGEGNPPVAVLFNSSDIRGGNICCGDPLTRNGPYSLFIDPEYKFESIAQGDYVLTIMAGSFDFQESLPNPGTGQRAAYHSHLQGFSEIGLDTLDMQANLTQKGLAFIGWSQFQIPNSGQTFYGTSTDQLLTESFSIQRDVNTARITTLPIGPSSQFSRLWFNVDTDNNDVIKTTLYGVQRDPNSTNITFDSLFQFDGVSPSNGFDLGLIASIRNYDEISLSMELTDNSANPSVAQLKNWRVAYEPSAEGVLIQTSEETKDVVQQGESFSYSYDFHNISTRAFQDSVLITFIYQPVNAQFQSFTDSLLIAPLPPNSTRSISLSPDSWSKNDITKRLSGETEITTYVNSDRAINELHYNNNSSVERILIQSDSTNPLIEVLFDGQRIINGDFVSPSANINVSLIDENDYLSLKDNYTQDSENDTTSLLTIFLQQEGDDENPTLLDVNNADIESFNNKNQIVSSFDINEVAPVKYLDDDGTLSSGRYTIEVLGQDATGNNSGYDRTDERANKLRVEFEVNKEAAITNFYPYPNPFSDNVRFVFQITGTEVPDQIKIQIMTVTGRVVKEIFQDELGPIRIGTNISEYAWDGRDEFGDQLANGVYLYRVIIPQKANQTFKHRETSKDNLFKHNIGKLYLLK
ncbi:putative type IX secretion system sortase PorU2 [Flammeovirga agarivorans]|uniref:Gingipain domain-containing protein n=1 Tax=Flammeovirga agarivorans TaxID=2726742 RepID=A0A7X8SN65_9BACT|nr:C25 family cysteine peptidase [Flammeovirga agarivorans]NLR93217.1 hypothetical protein [Flammeovirga agarivorans]